MIVLILFWNLKSEGGARLNYQNFRKAKAIERKNRERLLKVNPKLKDLIKFLEILKKVIIHA